MSFLVIVGFSYNTFQCLLCSFAPIFCRGRASTRRPRQPASIDATVGLGLALQFLFSTMERKNMMVSFGLTPACLSFYLWFSLRCLDFTLPYLPEACIQWQTRELLDLNFTTRLTSGKETLICWMNHSRWWTLLTSLCPATVHRTALRVLLIHLQILAAAE